MATRAPADFLPLSPQKFHILLSLADRDRHGYAIMQEVEARTAGGIRLGPGTLYGAVKRMRSAGLIAEADAPAGEDPRRRSYALTPLGRAVAVAEAARMAALVDAARGKRLLPEGA